MKKNSKILVAGNKGMVGSAIIRNLESKGFNNLILGSRQTVNFIDQQQVEHFFKTENPEYVFVAAAKVGGIKANNDKPADFLYENLMIQNNIIYSAFKLGVKKLLFLGSSCIYPKFASQPITEDQLLTGLLEPTNESYAIAKIAGIKLCQGLKRQYGFNGISLMPTNLYGINDNFDLETSHVLPALIRRFHEAKMNGSKEVICWGDGSAMREFLHVDDLAEACFVSMEDYNELDFLNVGTGKDVTIKQLTESIADVIGYDGKISWDTTKPNGTPRKVLNVDKIKSLGWTPTIELKEGIKSTYEWYIKEDSSKCKKD
jgi:GDP-L-fucose synthase